MKNHLKRLAAPRNWRIDRKSQKYIVRPKPGPHPLSLSLPLGIIIRDSFKIAETMREVKILLKNKTVLVDGKKREEYRLPVGLFDVISLPEIKENYRIVLDTKGNVSVKKIEPEEASIKPCKIVGKKTLKQKIQLNLHDGKNILVDKEFKCKIGDSVLITLPENKIKSLLELKKDAIVYLIKGKHGGDVGTLKEIKNQLATYQKEEKEIETSKDYLFVIGEKKSVIKMD